MGWTRYLPNVPEVLARWELRVWIVAGFLGVVAILLGFVAREIARQRGVLIQVQLDTAIEQRDAKAEEVKRMAEEARRKALEIEARQAPRPISEDEGARFVATLSNLPRGPLKVTSVSGDPETDNLAQRFEALLRRAGWEPDRESALFFGSPRGLIVSVRDLGNRPAHAASILKALTAIGVDVTVQASDQIPVGGVNLVIGHKP